MECFDHQDVEAVGICKTCNKGLCKKCAIPIGFAIVCRGDCESQAVMLQSQIQETQVTNLLVQRNRYLMPLIYALIGLVLLTSELSMRGWHFSPMTIFGIGIIVFALYMLKVSYQWGREFESRDDR